MTRLLLIEDDAKLAAILMSDFELEGFDVIHAKDGLEGLEKVKREKPSIILLDVMLPKMSGYDVCRTLRRDGVQTPILMLTAKGQEAEKVIGLNLGADDYLTKPFGSLELMARIKALLRRHNPFDAGGPIKIDDLSVDFKRMEVAKSGKKLDLTHKEFQVLELMIKRRGQVISRRQFLEDVWGYDSYPTTRTVDNTVFNLRQKLTGSKDDAERYITTVHGVGYKFVG